jgi:phosphoribosylformylglycinamidine synthase
VALAEMAVAGGLGARVALANAPRAPEADRDFVLLFSESPSRFVLEVRPEHRGELAGLFDGLPVGWIGEVTSGNGRREPPAPRLTVIGLLEQAVIDAEVSKLKETWQRPLRWP